jgi:hypothetical protein
VEPLVRQADVGIGPTQPFWPPPEVNASRHSVYVASDAAPSGQLPAPSVYAT